MGAENNKMTEISGAYITVNSRIYKFTSGKKIEKEAAQCRKSLKGGTLQSRPVMYVTRKKEKNLFGLVPWDNR